MRGSLRVGIIVFGCWLAASACSGTSSGNPVKPQDGVKTRGEGLLKSELPRDLAPEVDPADGARFTADNRAFAFSLYRKLGAEPGNLFFSPFSASYALAMTYAGARGKTASEMMDALHFSLPRAVLDAAFNSTSLDLAMRKDDVTMSEGGDGFTLDLDAQAFGQVGYLFQTTYLDELAKNYGAGLYLVDFKQADAARKLINDWASNNTAGRVPELLPNDAITPGETRLVLGQTIYFKASWLVDFNEANTQTADFHAPDATRSVPMMQTTSVLRYASFADYQALELSYLSPGVSMLLVLPSDGQFESVEASLSDTLPGLRSQLAGTLATVYLPRFQFASDHTLKAPLRELGMNAAFSPGEADFTGISTDEQLHVFEVYHDAFIAVDEHGTEAAAATAVVINSDGSASTAQPIDVRFDRPFIFLIYDEPTGTILFLGRLVDPG